MRGRYLLLVLLVSLSACTTAFEIGESLNQATSNLARNPNILWGIAEPASAPAASSPEPTATPKEEAK